MSPSNVQMLVTHAVAPEMSLPRSRLLTLTRNFGLVVGICLAALFTVPVLIAWTASILLN